MNDYDLVLKSNDVDYLKHLNSEQYTYFIVMNGSVDLTNKIELKDSLKALKLTNNFDTNNYMSYCVVSKKQNVAERISNNEITLIGFIEGTSHPYQILSSGLTSGKANASIEIDDTSYKMEQGLNIVVYDHILNKVIDQHCIK